MIAQQLTRRSLLKSSLSFGVAALWLNRTERASGFISANERPRVGAIGTGSRWCQKATGIDGPWGSAPDFRKCGDYIAVCDADTTRRYPVDPSQYNTATEFLIQATFADGIEIEIRHDGDNGILFEGTEGRAAS